jgi:hypothetical protein
MIGLRASPSLTRRIDVWAAANGITSRSEAIRRLVERGLAAPQPADPYAAFERAVARLRDAAEAAGLAAPQPDDPYAAFERAIARLKNAPDQK